MGFNSLFEEKARLLGNSSQTDGERGEKREGISSINFNEMQIFCSFYKTPQSTAFPPALLSVCVFVCVCVEQSGDCVSPTRDAPETVEF